MTRLPDRPLPLAAWPAADWRFLVPDPVGRAGFFGPPAPGETEVLREAGVQVVDLTGDDAAARSDAAAAAGLDVVVVTAERPGGLAAAAGALRPGGWMLLRVGRGADDPAWPSLRGRGGPGSVVDPAGAWTRNVRASGLEVRGRFWHAPHARRCSYVVALDQRAAVDAVLRRHHGVRFGAAKSVVARMLNRAGLTALLAGQVTVLARVPVELAREGDDLPGVGDKRTWNDDEPTRDDELTTHADSPASPGRSAPGPPGPPAHRQTGYNVVADLLPGEVEAGTGTADQWFLVTPWFEASRHVVRLYLDRGSGSPVTVAKFPRRPWDTGGIRHEADVLRDLARRTDALAGRVPAVLDLQLDGRPYLFESAVVGRAVGPEVVRSRPGEVLDRAANFVDSLPTTGTTAQDPGWFARLLEGPLTEAALAVGLRELPGLVDRTLSCLESLRAADLPLVLEHGDLGHPNLVLGERGLGAVDWERAEPYGLPGHDLCFFLQYAAEALRGTFERPGQLRAYDDALTGPGAWARPWLERYAQARGVDERWLPALILASWARSSAGLVRRLASSETLHVEVAEGLAEAFAVDRDFALWRHSVDRFDRLLT